MSKAMGIIYFNNLVFKANVVCKQLGYQRAELYYNSSFFGPVSMPFAMSGVKCIGNENYLELCSRNSDTTCSTSKAAGVICTNETATTVTTTTTSIFF